MSGKYDAIALAALDEANASGVVLIVIGGEQGDGVSIAAAPDIPERLPALLRTLADEIERELRDASG